MYKDERIELIQALLNKAEVSVNGFEHLSELISEINIPENRVDNAEWKAYRDALGLRGGI